MSSADWYRRPTSRSIAVRAMACSGSGVDGSISTGKRGVPPRIPSIVVRSSPR